MRATVLLCVLAALGAAASTTRTWVPNSWESTAVSNPSGIGVFQVPIPSGLSGTYTLSLADFGLYDGNNYMLCNPALVSVQGAQNQAVMIGTWGDVLPGGRVRLPGGGAELLRRDRPGVPAVRAQRGQPVDAVDGPGRDAHEHQRDPRAVQQPAGRAGRPPRRLGTRVPADGVKTAPPRTFLRAGVVVHVVRAET
ncbi:MAG: hypothetical protein KGL39_01395 [Patescibacteria group bacterium]|nr:hypothetical protein [Patescibacteria group bacterium]